MYMHVHHNMMQVCTLYVVCTRNVVCAHTHMYIIIARRNTLPQYKVTVSEVQAASPCQWTGDANSTSQSTVRLFTARRSRNSHHSYIHTSHSPSLIYSSLDLNSLTMYKNSGAMFCVHTCTSWSVKGNATMYTAARAEKTDTRDYIPPQTLITWTMISIASQYQKPLCMFLCTCACIRC